MPAAFLFAISLFALWLMLSANFSPILLAFGAGSAIFTATMQYRMQQIMPIKGRFRLNLWAAIKYAGWLIIEIIRANIQIARVILSPFSKIAPKMISIPAPQKSELGQVIFANSITLTPGTVSVETSGHNILIHALNAKAADASALADMGRRINIIESSIIESSEK